MIDLCNFIDNSKLNNLKTYYQLSDLKDEAGKP